MTGTLYYQDRELMMDGVLLAGIAARAGTPVYVYSLRRVLAQLDRLRTAFAPLVPELHYSMKANSSGQLVRRLVAAGCGCDTVSAGEIFMALRAGCPPQQIVCAGVGKTEAEIRYALEQGVGWLNVENPAELARVERLAAGRTELVRVALRVNPALQAATHRHIGSQLGRPDESAAAAQIALDLCREFGLTHLNLGGGFPVAYEGGQVVSVEAFAAALIPVLARQGVTVAFEPGRYLVAEAGVLLAEVQYIKRAGQTVVLDAGMTDLLRPALYEARHLIVPLREDTGETRPRQVVGPICESTDVLHPAAVLPDLAAGDRVAIGMAGAYGMTMASNYNGRPRPAEVLVEGDSWRVIRQRETLEDLVRHETV